VAAIDLTSSNFQSEVMESDVPVLIDLWAAWCGPCRMVAPVVDELGRDYAGRLKVAKLDVDAEPELAMRYEVMSIPTLMIFHKGSLEKRLVGARSKSQLMTELAQFIS
jgi:thioredoxin 1